MFSILNLTRAEKITYRINDMFLYIFYIYIYNK